MDYAVECVAALERAQDLVRRGEIEGDPAAMEESIKRWWRPAALSFFNELELWEYVAHLRSFDDEISAEDAEAHARQCLAGPEAMPR